MAPPSGVDQLSPQLANFEYLHQPGSQQPVEYIPVDDFFDQYLELLNFSEDGGPAAGMAKGARIDAAELPEEEIGEARASCSLEFGSFRFYQLPWLAQDLGSDYHLRACPKTHRPD